MEINRIIQGDCLEILKSLLSGSVDMAITSPPYWALRDYGIAGQLGLEPTLEEYVSKLCDIFDEVKRVLKPAGSCWVNLGDTYFGGGRNKGNSKPHPKGVRGLTNLGDSVPGPKGQDKALAQIPSRFAIEMARRGWILRNEVIWHKPNCMPASVRDRFTVDFEKVFFFVKEKKYHFEQQLEPYTAPLDRWGGENIKNKPTTKGDNFAVKTRADRNMRPNPNGRNRRSVWSIPTKPFKDAHFATFPEELVRVPIEAGCPSMVCEKCGTPRVKLFKRIEIGRDESDTKYNTKESTAGRLAQKRQAYRAMGFENPPAPEFIGWSDCGCNAPFKAGIVLDPFMGAGTTAVVAKKLGRNYLGIEINASYIDLARAYGYDKSIDARSQFLFASFLEDLYGTTQSQSLQSQITKGVNSAEEATGALTDVATGNASGLLSKAVRKGINLVRNITPERQIEAVRALIK